jgi:hypothetical protein
MSSLSRLSVRAERASPVSSGESPTPPAPRLRVWGATGDPNGRRRTLTSAQFSEIRRKRADLDAKLRQMTAAERDRRR